MNGVEILATEQVATAFGFGWALFFFLGILFSILLGGLAWCLAEEGGLSSVGTRISVCVGIVIALALAVLMGRISDTGAPTEFETHYKVTISDDVSMSEFLERYEIIDQDGKIFIVREVE